MLNMSDGARTSISKWWGICYGWTYMRANGRIMKKNFKWGLSPPDINEYTYEIDRGLHKKLGVPILWKYM